MRYLVDGHNLIPNIPGMRLELLDDEIELVQRLLTFCARGSHQVDVYFDNAPPGQVGVRRFGQVTAHFVRAGSTADAAIVRRLVDLGKQARQWCVVSSDRSVLAAARAAQAEVLTSPAFAQKMQAEPGLPNADKQDVPLDPGEVDEWLRIFQNRKPAPGIPTEPRKKRDS